MTTTNPTTAQINTSFSASLILKQLGGNRFIAMTGARRFAQDQKKQMIEFKIGGGAKSSINYIRITLNSMDTYDMEFLRVGKNGIKIINKEPGVYEDMLQDIFTSNTGLNTHL